MKLRTLTGDDNRVTMYIDGDRARLVTVRCRGALSVSRKLQLCVNMHDAMVEALRFFSSAEMGTMLIDAVVAMSPEDERVPVIEERMRLLVNAVDVIMKGVELSEIVPESKH